jgi:DNA-binding MarR family transcriptional regulator
MAVDGDAVLRAAAGAPSDDRDPVALMALLCEVHNRLTRTLTGELEDLCGLPLPWFEAMYHLRLAPAGFLTMTRLGTEIALTSGGVTRLVDRLVDAGYVERQACPTDRRSVFVALTPRGAAKVDEAAAAHRQALERDLLGRLEPEDRCALDRVLRKLRAG